jgi:hypothetical protein
MSPDLLFWLALATKLIITAGFVVLASWTAERAGPLVGAMVVTLPVAAGPAYVFLALDHDSDFIAASALTSLVSNAATIVFCAVYSTLAQSRGRMVSLCLAFAAWVAFVTLLRPLGATLPAAFAVNVVVILVCAPIGWRLRHAAMPPVIRRWYDVPLRAGMVATLVATVVTLSVQLGPATTGILALIPIVMISLILLLHRRLGGPAMAAILANSIPGLVGFCFALVSLHLLAPRTGTAPALAAALAVSIGWNLILFAVSRYARLRRRHAA